MYIPEKMKIPSLEASHQFIGQFGFGIIISEPLEGTHLPFLLNKNEGEFGTLYCHFARANPQWKNIKNNKVMVIFNGPHAYISPSWYAKTPAVPTWNYAAVHIYGTVEVVDNAQTLLIIKNTIAKYEPDLTDNQQICPDEHQTKLANAIVGVKIPIKQIEGKLKLGQHRSLDDQRGVVAGLSAVNHPRADELLTYMQQLEVGIG